MPKYDACIVLGGGVLDDGTVSATSKARVDAAIKHYNDGDAAFLLMSGAQSWRDQDQKKATEAEAMFDYALSQGVPQSQVLSEEKSKDTLTNAYFCKLDFALPRGWKALLVVTSLHHLPRTEYTFRKVFGDGFKIHFSGIDALGMRHNHEDKIIDILKHYLDPVADGDDKTIGELIYKAHPGFNDNADSRARLLKQIGE